MGIKLEHIIFANSSILKLTKMRKQQEIIKEINETQTIFNELTMSIGQLYAQHSLTKDQKLVPRINDKVNALQKVELRLRILEQELAKTEE